MRDNFDQKTKDVLFKRARGKCSNPACRRETTLAHTDPGKAVNLGEAAHITAASPGGKRYDPSFSVEERKSIQNALWLCGTCAKLIDSDEAKYPVTLLQQWKTLAESADEHEIARVAMFRKLEKLMPALLAEMRADLAAYPLARELILLNRSWTYNSDKLILVYYYDDHNHLEDCMTILCNHQLLVEVTYNDVKRYRLTEALVDYLTQDQ